MRELRGPLALFFPSLFPVFSPSITLDPFNRQFFLKSLHFLIFFSPIFSIFVAFYLFSILFFLNNSKYLLLVEFTYFWGKFKTFPSVILIHFHTTKEQDDAETVWICLGSTSLALERNCSDIRCSHYGKKMNYVSVTGQRPPLTHCHTALWPWPRLEPRGMLELLRSWAAPPTTDQFSKTHEKSVQFSINLYIYIQVFYILPGIIPDGKTCQIVLFIHLKCLI